jgi:glycosyltransferase involved in cell wall biosynthesis
LTSEPRVVIAHDFLEAHGGAERTAATIAATFANAPVFAILGRRSVAARMGVEERTSFLLDAPERALRHYRALTPLYPGLVAARRLPAADALVTSSYAFAHGLRTRNDAPQLCYCHSPLRFAWVMTEEYGRRIGRGRAGARALSALAAPMRWADRRAARRVDRYIASSSYVAQQLERFYGVAAEVLHPPVDTELFRPAERPEDHDGYFLFCGRLVEPYKRPGLAVDAFRGTGLRLLVAGDGPALADLRARAGDNVEFLGNLRDDELVPLMQRCAAAIFPSRDDFGLIPVEVAACGRPTLAFAAGGALETLAPGVTGEFFDRQQAETLRAAVQAFDPDRYDPDAIRRHALGWSAERFQARLRALVGELAAR